MKRAAYLLTLSLLVAGCGEAEVPSAQLNAENARQAIIEWIEASHNSVLEMSLDFLHAEPIQDDGEGKVSIGAFEIDLKQHSFVVSIIGTDVFAAYAGRFIYD